MAHEIELINDGDGVAVIGDHSVVERFLSSQGIPSQELDLRRFGSALGSAVGIAQARSDISAESGRWVKLTKESAAALEKSALMKGSKEGVSRAILTEDGGKINGILEIVDGPGKMLANPALLAGASGVMAQMAMQQTMDEITDYLAAIDAKVDDVLRAQKDSVIADMLGVDFVLDEALEIRKHVGRVSDITWSKVQATNLTVARTQAYALKQLEGIAEKLESSNKVGDLADEARKAEGSVREWLAVLAHCFRLQEGIAVLELDRILDSSPSELDSHRMALRNARQRRLGHLATSTASLIERMNAAAGTADAGLLFNPLAAPKVVNSRNRIHNDVVEFQQRLGLEGEQAMLEGRRWRDAAIEARDKVVTTSADGLEAAVRVGSDTLENARSATERATEGFGQRMRRKRSNEDAAEDSSRRGLSRASKLLPRLTSKKPTSER